jgi:hypothetical protein
VLNVCKFTADVIMIEGNWFCASVPRERERERQDASFLTNKDHWATTGTLISPTDQIHPLNVCPRKKKRRHWDPFPNHEHCVEKGKSVL